MLSRVWGNPCRQTTSYTLSGIVTVFEEMTTPPCFADRAICGTVVVVVVVLKDDIRYNSI